LRLQFYFFEDKSMYEAYDAYFDCNYE